MKTKYLIIGAGVSGLSFANFINDDDYLIVEKECEVGGYCRTIYKDDYVWDYAGHFFHFNNEEIKKFFLNNISKDELVTSKKCTKIFYKDKLIDYPFQKNIHQLDKEEFIDCLYDLYNKNEKKSYENFKDMLYGKFGRGISEKFLIPYNEKLYACDLNILDENAMGRFFPYANINEIINNMRDKEDDSYNNTFLYPKKGAITFINVLRNKLSGKKILLNSEIVKIDYNKKRAHLKNGEVIEYKYIINTSSYNKFIEFLNIEKYKELAGKLSFNKVLVFNLGFNKKSDLTEEHWIYIPDKEINFYRVGFYDNILGTDKLSMYIEIGYSEDGEIDIQEQLKLTLDNLRKMNIINDHDLVSYSTIIMAPAYVHICSETDKIITHHINELRDIGIYNIGRYGMWKYCSIEDSIIDAKKLAERFNSNVDSDIFM